MADKLGRLDREVASDRNVPRKARGTNHESGRPVVHGVNRYKVYACRCDVCKAAMSAYGKARYIPASDVRAAAPASSWWLGASPEKFTERVQKEQFPRMKASKFGSWSKLIGEAAL